MIQRESPLPLYQQLFIILKQKIVNGSIPVGSKLPGEDEIEAFYNVSRTTVRQAIEILVKEGFVNKQQGKGTFVIANKPKSIQTIQGLKSIAFLLPDLLQQYANNIAASVVSKVETCLQQKRFNLTLAQSKYSIQNENHILQVLARENAGIIWLPEDESYRAASHYAFQLAADGYPLLLFDRTIKGLDAGYVVTDNYAAMASLIQYLISLGHRSIAFYGTLTHRPTSLEDRFNGYLHTIAKNGLTINYDWIFPEGEKGLHQLFLCLSQKERPTAVVCKDDIDAYQVIEKALGVGLNIPQDLSVTGFDNLKINFYDLKLTTVNQDPDLLGSYLAEQMITAVNANLPLGKIVLPAPLIVGNTTCPVKE